MDRSDTPSTNKSLEATSKVGQEKLHKLITSVVFINTRISIGAIFNAPGDSAFTKVLIQVVISWKTFKLV